MNAMKTHPANGGTCKKTPKEKSSGIRMALNKNVA
jgi:hypothetical protein